MYVCACVGDGCVPDSACVRGKGEKRQTKASRWSPEREGERESARFPFRPFQLLLHLLFLLRSSCSSSPPYPSLASLPSHRRKVINTSGRCAGEAHTAVGRGVASTLCEFNCANRSTSPRGGEEIFRSPSERR